MAPDNGRGIGAVLTRYRTAAGLTVDEVAELMGVRRSQVAKYEADEVEPPDHRLEAFAVAVGVLPVELSLECLFHVEPQLRNKPTGRLFQEGLDEHRAALAAEEKQGKAAGKKPPARKPATRTPPRRRVSR